MTERIRLRGVAKTNNPVNVADGVEVDALLDKKGRQVVTMHHLREALVSASASVSNGTKTTLMAGNTEYLHDLVYLTASNSSTSAYSVTLSDDGTDVYVFSVPGSSVTELKPSIPIPQSAKGGNWQVDLADITGGTITLYALFSKNT